MPVFFLPNILCVHVRKLGTSVRKSTTKSDLQNLQNRDQWCSEQTSRSLFVIQRRDTVRSGAEERTFGGARLDVLIFRLRSYHVLISYSAECNGPKFYKTMMFLGQAGMFLSFQAR